MGCSSCNRERTIIHSILVVKPDRRLLGRQMIRCKDNIEIYFREIYRGHTKWIKLAQNADNRLAFVIAMMNPQFTYRESVVHLNLKGYPAQSSYVVTSSHK